MVFPSDEPASAITLDCGASVMLAVTEAERRLLGADPDSGGALHAEHEIFKPPSNRDISVWRYVDLAKLLSLLQHRSLWLSRADQLGDPHEGSIGRVSADLREQQYRSIEWAPSAPPDIVERLLGQGSDVTQGFTRHTFVNCWHINESESMAMWRIYGGAGAPVAIRSTFERLCASLQGEEPTYVGQVRYVDPDVDLIPYGNALAPFVHKRHSYSYERELRAVQLRMPDAGGSLDLNTPSSSGVAEPVDLGKLIGQIVVGPSQPAWLLETVETTVAAYAPELSVVPSSVDIDPIW